MKSHERMRAAYAAYQKGDLQSALVQSEAALKALPRDHNVLQFAGVVAAQCGFTDKAAEYLRKAIANGGNSDDNRINLAKVLAELGQWDEALQLCRPASGNVSTDLQRLEAELLKSQGRPTEAVWAYERVVHEQPENFDAWNNLGNARHDSGDLDAALDAFHRARTIDPQSSIVHTNLARVLMSKDRYEDACMMLEQAAILAPGESAPLLELGKTLTSLGHAEAGLRPLGDAARINQKDPEIFIAIGQAFADMAQQLQAERALKFALQAGPRNLSAYLNLGILFEKANRVDELKALLTEADRNELAGSEIDYLQSLLLVREGRNEEALSVVGSLRTEAIDEATLAQIKGQLLDKLGRADEAFYAYEDMNRAAANTPLGLGNDRSAYQRTIDGLNFKTTAEWVRNWAAASVTTTKVNSPVFLVGFPRSGTTLLDTILMGHSATQVYEEVPALENLSAAIGGLDRIATLGTSEIAELRTRYFAELARHSPLQEGKAIIDKNPLSMVRAPLIHRLFPDAKIIFAMRHPCDVVLSCYMQNFKPTEAMSSFLDLANASRTYDRIFAYWQQCQNVLPLNVHMLRYEAMVEDVEAEVRPLFDFLGLEWESGVLDHQKTARERGYIRTPSYAQVTEKVYSSASGRWQRYRTHMNEILPILQPWAEAYGYSID